ncbi:hypothetical protein [Luteolibacter sp. AS25]|uniref:hypothetical protein n=1 Tax=Luteolibacter sp. AS25 TaxID=3135776 RepID=UPI00398BA7FE
MAVYAAYEYFQNIPVGLEPPPVEIVSPPLTLLKEAENCDFNGQTVSDTGASNFSAIESGNEIEAFALNCEIPESDRVLSIWVRKKGGRIAISAPGGGIISGSLTDSSNESGFSWSHLGKIRPADLPESLVFHKIEGEGVPVSIDCILFADHEIENKDSLLTSLEALQIDPTRAISDFRNGSEAWGYNLPVAVDPGEIPPSCVLRVTLRNWDEESCREMVASFLEKGKTAKIILNFPGWPDEMDADGDGYLDESSKQDYSELVTRLSGVVLESPQAKGRVFLELFHRPEGKYYHELVDKKKIHRVAELARIYLSTAEEIRKNHPEAKIGAIAAVISPDSGFHDQFIAMTAPALDFYAIQADIRQGTEFIYTIKGHLKKNSVSRRIPLLISDIDSDQKGGVTELVPNTWFLIRAFLHGAETAFVSMNGFSPSIDEQEDGHAFHQLHDILNIRFSGLCAAFQTTDPESLSALTTQDQKSLLLVYKGAMDRDLILPSGSWAGYLLEGNSSKFREISIDGIFKLPGRSILCLERKKKN